MSSKAKRRRDRLARRRRAAQEIAISEERKRKRRWGDGHILGPKVDVDLPPMRDVTEVIAACAEGPWPVVVMGGMVNSQIDEFRRAAEVAMANALGVPLPVLYGKGWPR